MSNTRKHRLLVAKFGGTSLLNGESRERATEHCLALLNETHRLIVVVSAMGRMGDPYSTDTLLSLTGDASSETEKDRLMACGEVISAVVMASTLRKHGIDAEALTGWEAGIETDGVSGNARIVRVNTALIEDSLERARVLVITGFQGVAPCGTVNTLGRGGTDTTAVVLGVAMKADAVLLYKTVESVYTADPERVPEARSIKRISAEDLRQMAWQGANVVNPRAAESALSSGLCLQVRSFSKGKVVTDILPDPLEDTRYIVGVASGPVVTSISAYGSGKPSAFFATLFRKVADSGVSMDMFSVKGCGASFTVPVESTDSVAALMDSLGFRREMITPCVKVSIVGAGMHGLRGVMARFCEALDRAGIDALQTVDSHATISALIGLEHRDSALASLHREFIE